MLEKLIRAERSLAQLNHTTSCQRRFFTLLIGLQDCSFYWVSERSAHCRKWS